MKNLELEFDSEFAADGILRAHYRPELPDVEEEWSRKYGVEHVPLCFGGISKIYDGDAVCGYMATTLTPLGGRRVVKTLEKAKTLLREWAKGLPGDE